MTAMRNPSSGLLSLRPTASDLAPRESPLLSSIANTPCSLHVAKRGKATRTLGMRLSEWQNSESRWPEGTGEPKSKRSSSLSRHWGGSRRVPGRRIGRGFVRFVRSELSGFHRAKLSRASFSDFYVLRPHHLFSPCCITWLSQRRQVGTRQVTRTRRLQPADGHRGPRYHQLVTQHRPALHLRTGPGGASRIEFPWDRI